MRGYAPDRGYPFLIDAIVRHDFAQHDIDVRTNEVFISDGAKSDTGNFGDTLSADNRIAVTDPVYPVYVDTNVMGGRAGALHDGRWSNICYLPCTAQNRFTPSLPDTPVDVVYLCYPNNPTGTTLSKAELKKWVDYARQNDVLILFDAAYEAFITEPNVPHSIYEIEGAKEVAVEFRSFSKTAGFTGVRCGYTVVPKGLTVKTASGERAELNSIWARRQATKFNGAAYIVQRAAEATYSSEGRKQIQNTIDYYRRNAYLIKAGLEIAGLETYGGVNAPYIWARTPQGMSSWECFEYLLTQAQVVITPGAGFGASGEGYIRLTSFGKKAETMEAVERIKKLGFGV
jgi:LL-diaminopimelate aminotransferase